MTNFNSQTNLNTNINQVYNFLANLNNHSQLMPSNVTNWQCGGNQATFAIKNMANLALSITAVIQNSEILISSSTPSPFALTLCWRLIVEDNSTLVTLNLDAELSTMLKMLASTALQKLVDYQTSTLKEILG